MLGDEHCDVSRPARVKMECRRCGTALIAPVERTDARPGACTTGGAMFPKHSVSSFMRGLRELRSTLFGPDGHFLVGVGVEIEGHEQD